MNGISVSDTPTPVSLFEIRARHVELMEETLIAPSVTDLASTIVEFMSWVAQAGVHLQGEDQRVIAQGVLDYWNATLLTSDARSAGPRRLNSRTLFNFPAARKVGLKIHLRISASLAWTTIIDFSVGTQPSRRSSIFYNAIPLCF